MTLADEVFRHSHHAVRDAINVWRERLRNDRDPHVFKIARAVKPADLKAMANGQPCQPIVDNSQLIAYTIEP